MPRTKKSHEISYIEDAGQVKFYLRRPIYLYVPTSLKEGDYNPLFETSPPDEELELEWVYGYRGRDSRNNLHVLGSGDVVYFTAGVAVVYSAADHTQRFYTQHSDDIKSLAVHPDGETVATGQVKGCDDEVDAAHIRVWSATTLETLHVFGMGELERGVSCLAFSTSDGGALLAATDDAPEPNLTVWEWADESKLAGVKCSGDPVLAVNFSREESPRIITTGKNSVMFWTVDGESLKKRTGIFGDTPKPKYVTAVSFTGRGETVTGDSNGNIVIWSKGGNDVSRLVSGVHSGSIFFILPTKDGGFLTSGKDMLIKKWDGRFKSAGEPIQISDDLGAVRTIAEVGDGGLVVGTVKNILAKGSLEDTFSVITRGSQDELWGIAAHPTEDRFLTGSLDGEVAERSASGRELLWTMEFNGGVQSVTYSPTGSVAVVGLVNGGWDVVDIERRKVVHKGQDGDEPIQVVRFSPDGSLLAMGSRDNSIYIYETADPHHEYTKRGECSGHSSFIRCLDFSADGQFIRTNSGDYELLFWNMSDCSQETDSSSMSDTDWATRTCLLSFENFGVWPEGVDGTDLNAVTGAHSKALVATADDFGKVKLFKGNTHYAYTANKSYQGHSSHVTNLTFLHDDATLVSVGGNDCSALQWRVVAGE